MKKVLLLIFYLPILLNAQNTEGKVDYKETIQLNINAEGLDEEMMKMIPKSQSSNQVLYFNENESIYKAMDEQEESGFETGSEEEGMQIQVKIARPDNQFYKNLKEQKKIELREFFSRKFLIDDQLEKMTWKLTGKQKKILDYVCQEATTTRDSTVIKAWFTPQIAVSNGPQVYGGLPGLILELDIDDGQRTIVANKVVLGKLEKGIILAPKKAKKITEEKFNKMQEEKLKEMGSQGGNTVIKIRTN